MLQFERVSGMSLSSYSVTIRRLKVIIRNPMAALFFISLVLVRLMVSKERYDNLCRHLQSKVIWRLRNGTPINSHLIFSILPDGIRLLCPLVDGGLVSEIFVHEVYDRFFKPSQGEIVIDVGAHVGVYTLKAAKAVSEKGLVVAIEPYPYNHRLLEWNVAINDLKNVLLLNIAVGHKRGKIKLYLDPIDLGAHSIVFKRSSRYLKVPCETLDDITREYGIEHVDLIKMDVEGAELKVLEGAQGILRSKGLRIVAAAYHTPTMASEVVGFLLSRGFKALSLNGFVYACKL